MSISMVVQTFSPIRCFPHNKWPRKVRRKKKKEQNKKSRQAHRRSRRGTDAPNIERSTNIDFSERCTYIFS